MHTKHSESELHFLLGDAAECHSSAGSGYSEPSGFSSDIWHRILCGFPLMSWVNPLGQRRQHQEILIIALTQVCSSLSYLGQRSSHAGWAPAWERGRATNSVMASPLQVCQHMQSCKKLALTACHLLRFICT